MTEAEIEHAIRKRLGRETDIVLWRNNSGYHTDTTGRGLRYGLCPGSSDLIAILHPGGRFCAFEVKSAKGKLTDLQKHFIQLVRDFGGFACVVRSVEEAEAALARARAGENC